MRLNMFYWFKRLRTKISSVNDKIAISEKLNKDELEFLPAALEVVETPPSPIGRAIIWLLISLFTIAVIWSCIGHIDEVGVAQGKVIPSGYTKTIQAFDTGVVKSIHVKDGDKVQDGDVLIELDTTLTAADLARETKEAAHYQVEIKRLVAEQMGVPFIVEPNSDASPEDVLYQLELYRSRLAEYQAKVATTQQAVNQTRAALDSARATRQKLAEQLAITRTKQASMKELVDVGIVAEFQFLDLRQQVVGLEQDLAAQTSEMEKASYALQQSMETLNGTISERQRDIMEKLVDDRHRLQAAEEELRKAKEKNRLSTISSPINGTVQQLAVHTVGGVVTPAETLMLVVPEGEQMEIEAWVDNKDIGFLYPGQAAEIKVETFNFQKYGTLNATLVEISSDAVEDKDTDKNTDKSAYKSKGLVYRALLKTSVDHFDLISGRTVYLTPGMAVTAEIKTKQKRIIEYFMDPFIKYIKEGLRER